MSQTTEPIYDVTIIRENGQQIRKRLQERQLVHLLKVGGKEVSLEEVKETIRKYGLMAMRGEISGVPSGQSFMEIRIYKPTLLDYLKGLLRMVTNYHRKPDE
ncbi:hypothetical protein AB4099_34125 [Bosea sp. 2KB_26]|uniref:hypothetical protein n=1 Tax=Bosea sp. 2KB_26 TaxID=3237475 RepID=UPI003F8DCC42